MAVHIKDASMPQSPLERFIPDGSSSGGLKASDPLIEYICGQVEAEAKEIPGMPNAPIARKYGDALRAVIRRVEPLIDPSSPGGIESVVPGVDKFHLKLPLMRALEEYDQEAMVTKRRFVAPTFREVRHILNLAALEAVATCSIGLQLITLDADETIYSDGGTVSPDSPMVPLLCRLLTSGIRISLVTAAGYSQARRYE